MKEDSEDSEYSEMSLERKNNKHERCFKSSFFRVKNEYPTICTFCESPLLLHGNSKCDKMN